MVGYNFLWPLLAYLALRLDSKFWRRSGTSPAAWKDLGMPLLDVGACTLIFAWRGSRRLPCSTHLTCECMSVVRSRRGAERGCGC